MMQFQVFFLSFEISFVVQHMVHDGECLLLSFLKDSCAGYRTLGQQFLSCSLHFVSF